MPRAYPTTPKPEHLSDPGRFPWRPRPVVPAEVDHRIQGGAYRTCKDCDGQGELPVVSTRGEVLDEEACSPCNGIGYRVPHEDLRWVNEAGDVLEPSRFDVAAALPGAA